MRVTGLLGAAAVASMAAVVPAWADDVHGRSYGRGTYGRDGYAYGRDYRYGDSYRFGFDKGFEEGLRHGDKDGRKRVDFNFWHEKKYREGDHGYRSSYGTRGRYIQGFRSGYETGYREGYESIRFGRTGHGERGYGTYGRDGDGTYTGRYGTSPGPNGTYADGYYRDRNGILRDRYGRPVANDGSYRSRR